MIATIKVETLVENRVAAIVFMYYTINLETKNVLINCQQFPTLLSPATSPFPSLFFPAKENNWFKKEGVNVRRIYFV